MMEAQAESPMGILARVNAVLTGEHFVYTSGKHGSAYVNKDMIYPHTKETGLLCSAIAHRFALRDVAVVVGPEKGGIILSQWTASHLSRQCGREVLAVYAEKDGDRFVIKRGYEELIPGKKVLIVEDVLTTGGSVKKVVETVRTLGGDIVGVGAICNRGGVTEKDIGDPPVVELFALTNVKLDAWDADKCPLCSANIRINLSVGKGREFLAGKGMPAL